MALFTTCSFRVLLCFGPLAQNAQWPGQARSGENTDEMECESCSPIFRRLSLSYVSVWASAKAAVLNSKIFFVKLNKTVANVVEHVALVISGVFKYKNSARSVFQRQYILAFRLDCVWTRTIHIRYVWFWSIFLAGDSIFPRSVRKWCILCAGLEFLWALLHFQWFSLWPSFSQWLEPTFAS